MVLDKKGHVMIVFTGSVRLFKWLHSWRLRMNNKWVMNPPIGWIFKCSFFLINSPTIYICILVTYWHNYILLLWFLWCYFTVRGTLKCVLHTAEGPSLNKITAPLYICKHDLVAFPFILWIIKTVHFSFTFQAYTIQGQYAIPHPDVS